jgi:Lrp/AsnC family leucine-responsive transcriptional regulator
MQTGRAIERAEVPYPIITESIRNFVALFAKIHSFMQYMSSLDNISAKILHTIEKNGRISNTALSERVGLSPSACLRRVQELERTGWIKGYRAVLNRAKFGIGFTAYIAVGLSEHNKKSQKNFESAMSNSKEVIECHNVTGSFEYILRVETKDLTSYKTFHTEVLGTLPQVHSITTYVVMDSPKDERG